MASLILRLQLCCRDLKNSNGMAGGSDSRQRCIKTGGTFTFEKADRVR